MLSFPKWSDEEIAIIKKHYRNLGGDGCAELLPLRNPEACRRRASSLKISKPRQLMCRRTFDPMPKVRLNEYWESLPEDGRDNTGKIMGDPAYGRSALHKKMLQVTETKDDSSYEIGSFSDRVRVT